MSKRIKGGQPHGIFEEETEISKRCIKIGQRTEIYNSSKRVSRLKLRFVRDID